jgi:S1-C subfamily serine protease
VIAVARAWGEPAPALGPALAAAATPDPGPSDAELLDAYSSAVVGVVERAAPAVVSLEIAARATSRGGGRSGADSAGSGFVVTPDGYVMTNSHVVAGARAIRVRTSAGEIAEGQVMGDDPATDLALVRIDPAALAISPQAAPYLPAARPRGRACATAI